MLLKKPDTDPTLGKTPDPDPTLRKFIFSEILQQRSIFEGFKMLMLEPDPDPTKF